MKEIGILFTPDNIRAIREGRKTQTRRVISPQPTLERSVGFVWKGMAYGAGISDWEQGAKQNFVHKCHQGGVGDRMYIKEGVIVYKDEGWPKITGKKSGTLVGYYMDGARVENVWEKRLTAMFMAKRYSRTWLEITDVRVEQVHDISEEDCIAEGCPKEYLIGVNWYKHLWDEINGKKHPWASNPFVWCLSFKVVKP